MLTTKFDNLLSLMSDALIIPSEVIEILLRLISSIFSLISKVFKLLMLEVCTFGIALFWLSKSDSMLGKLSIGMVRRYNRNGKRRDWSSLPFMKHKKMGALNYSLFVTKIHWLTQRKAVIYTQPKMKTPA